MNDAVTTPTRPVLDVVIPVYNEEATIGACVHRLHAHLTQTFPYPFRITVADNASTDATLSRAEELATELSQVAVVHLTQKGRGRALTRVWLDSDALVLAYMDVDLSTDLDALWPLVAPLMSGHSDVAIGSRLAHGSRVVRGPCREFVSRSYNTLLRWGLGASFTDAQCGFKAIRADVAHELLPWVEDTAWFFDTELLVLAQRCALRIHEVPVDWFDDPDSRVDVLHTALDDLRGMARVRRTARAGTIPVADLAARLGRGRLGRRLGSEIGRFASVGVLSTGLHLGLFAALTSNGMPAQAANAVALILSTVANTAANRRWTFGAHGRDGAWRHHTQGLGIFALFWAVGAAALAAVDTLAPGAGTTTRTILLGAANIVATLVKFVVFRTSMDPDHGDRGFFVHDAPGAQENADRLLPDPATTRQTVAAPAARESALAMAG